MGFAVQAAAVRDKLQRSSRHGLPVFRRGYQGLWTRARTAAKLPESLVKMETAMRVLFLLPLICLTLTACEMAMPGPGPGPGPGPKPDPGPMVDLSQCGGNALLALVGQPATTLPDHGGWGALRVVRPGMMVTMDYSATRLNVHVDGAGKILALDCG